MSDTMGRPVTPAIFSGRAISRRQLLRGAGVALALPYLEAMTPAGARIAGAAEENQARPRRFLGICNNIGLLPDQFFPTEDGRDYTLTPYLEELRAHREDFTVFSGVSHPDVDGSHASDVSFLTAAPHPANGGFRNTISIDQFIASKIGHQTRFSSLTLGVNVNRGQRSLSYTGSGVLIPCEESPLNVYRQLFLQGSEEDVDRQLRRLELGESIMDVVADQANSMRRRVGAADRDRLDQYMTAVRDVENRLTIAGEWEQKPKPEAPVPAPPDPEDPSAYLKKVQLMYQMARLAFETDSTRSIALLLDSVNSPTIEVEGAKITDGYHNLSHHGRSEQKIEQLKAIDRWHLKLLDELFTDLKATSEAGATLLDRTMVLYGSNLGDANTHVTTNMPILFAGGGFRHGQHLAFDTRRNYPLPNLFVSALQRMGIEADSFASSTGTMQGLEPIG